MDAQFAGMMVFMVSFALFFESAVLAIEDKFYTPTQMRRQGLSVGLPFIANGAMWGDCFVISPLIGILTALYGNQWGLQEIIIAGTWGTVVSLALNLGVYRLTPIPEAHARNKRLTRVGWLHTAYMAIALTVILAFYFATQDPAPAIVVLTSFLLFLHVLAGTHIVPYLVRAPWYPGNPLRDPKSWLAVLGTASLLIWRTLVLIS